VLDLPGKHINLQLGAIFAPVEVWVFPAAPEASGEFKYFSESVDNLKS
jgi:hypothetical protein